MADAKLETEQKSKHRSAKPKLIRKMWPRTIPTGEKLTTE